jgi:hypothetical protein
MSTYDVLGWPTEVSVLLVSIAIVLALVPWFGGQELGPLKIPALGAARARRLRAWAWILPVLALAMYVPVWAKPDDTVFDVEIRFQSGSASPLDCAQLGQTLAVLTIAGQAPSRAPITATCTATFRKVPVVNRGRDAAIEMDGASPYVLRDAGAQYLEPGRPLVATLDEAQSAPRLRIAILPSPVDAAAPHLQQLQEALADKIVNVSQTFAGRGDAYAYLAQLKVWSEGPLSPSLKEMGDFWKLRHALEVVGGQVKQASQPLTVHSVIYLGDLAPLPQRETVRLDVTIAPDSFAHTRDSYSVVTLYALARDAQRMKRPPDVIAALLGEARAQAQQIDDPANALADIKAAIDAALSALRGAGP